MNSRAAAWLAWSLAGLSVAMFVAGGALYVLARSAQSPSHWATVTTFSDMLVSVLFLAFPLVGALIAARRPHVGGRGSVSRVGGTVQQRVHLVDARNPAEIIG
jgi:hypothetical protein